MNTSHKPSFSSIPPPKPDKEHEAEEFDISTELSGYGLQGVKMTNDELKQLAEELGLGSDDAGDLVQGLGSMDIKDKGKEKEIPKSGKAKKADVDANNLEMMKELKEAMSKKQKGPEEKPKPSAPSPTVESSQNEADSHVPQTESTPNKEDETEVQPDTTQDEKSTVEASE